MKFIIHRKVSNRDFCALFWKQLKSYEKYVFSLNYLINCLYVDCFGSFIRLIIIIVGHVVILICRRLRLWPIGYGVWRLRTRPVRRFRRGCWIAVECLNKMLRCVISTIIVTWRRQVLIEGRFWGSCRLLIRLNLIITLIMKRRLKMLRRLNTTLWCWHGCYRSRS